MRIARLNYVDVTCPVCERGSVRCHYEAGDSEVGIRGGVGDYEPDCPCSSSTLVDEEAYWRKLDEIADWSV